MLISLINYARKMGNPEILPPVTTYLKLQWSEEMLISLLINYAREMAIIKLAEVLPSITTYLSWSSTESDENCSSYSSKKKCIAN